VSAARIAVIIPAYNQAHYLCAAVDSVLASTFPDFELVIVNDGSTDRTAEVAASFNDPRVRTVHQANQGLSAARNTGIRCSQAPYLTFLDSDDLFLPEKLEVLSRALDDDSQLGLVAGQAVLIDQHGARLGSDFTGELPQPASRLVLGNPLHVGSVMLRREWQERVGFFDESLRSYEDWDLWLRLALAGCPMRSIPQPVSAYRFHTGQMIRNGAQMTQASFATLQKVYDRPDLPTEWLVLCENAFSQAHLRAAANAFLAGETADGSSHLAQAVRLNPGLLDQQAQPLADRLSAWTELPKVADPLSLLETVYRNLPPELETLRRRGRSDLANLALRQAFSAPPDSPQPARTALLRALRYQPLAVLANRGALALLARTLLRRSA
jgi:hypothetical protein